MLASPIGPQTTTFHSPYVIHASTRIVECFHFQLHAPSLGILLPKFEFKRSGEARHILFRSAPQHKDKTWLKCRPGKGAPQVRQSKAVATLPLACLAGQPGVGVSVDCVDDDGNGMDLCVHAITAQTELLEQPGQLPIRGTPAIWTARRRVVALVGPLLFVP
eukprot:scaffold31796_cov17-Tisochrysis_lutea.AAC.1